MSNATPTAAKKTAAKTAAKKPAATKPADTRADDQRNTTDAAKNAGGAAGDGDTGGSTTSEGAKTAASSNPKSGESANTPTTDTPPAQNSSSAPVGKKSKDDGLTTITVIGPTRGMRRSGHHFDATPRVVRVTTGELKAIEADPALAVTRGAVVDVPGPEGALPSSRDVADYLDMEGKPIAIKVLGPAKGRRRAGHEFAGQAVTITPASMDELALILADADLSVSPAA